MISLTERLGAEVAKSGPMRFDRFMECALFDPDLGYYSAGRASIGRTGDFHTSVSIGPALGIVLASQCAEVWGLLGNPADFEIVEEGSNDGRLAADILAALRSNHADCFACLRYRLVEPFDSLQARQAETLRPFSATVDWTKSLNGPFTGVHLTNEYVDALPVRIFVRHESGWLERHVDVGDSGLEFVDVTTEQFPASLPVDVPIGYCAEFRPQAVDWLEGIGSQLTRGLILIIDYGYPRDQLHAAWRKQGTLSCYRDNRRDDNPLESPGEKDITAHVDFTALTETALAAGLELAGFADQHHFIVGAGTPLLGELETAPPSATRDKLLRNLKTLLHPETMGTQFKYLGLTRGFTGTLSGFRHSRPAATTLGLDQYQMPGQANPNGGGPQ